MMQEDNILRSTGKQISILRNRRGLRQAELGRLIETSQAAISQIEKGQQNLSLEALDLIAASLGCRLDIRFRKLRKPITKAQPENISI